MSYFYIFGTVFFTVYGQIVIKWRMNGVSPLPEKFSEKIFYLFSLLLDPWIFSGFVSAFLASFFWMAAMKKFEVSYAYPVVVGGLIVLTSFFAIVFLRESVSLLKIMGIIFIIFGVYFLSEGA